MDHLMQRLMSGQLVFAEDDGAGAGGTDTSTDADNEPTSEESKSEDREVEGLRNAISAERAKRKEIEAELEKLRKAEDKRRKEQMTKEERLAEELAEAQARAEAAESRALEIERKTWVLAEASKAGFNDPADAAAFIDLSEVEDAEVAAEKVAQLLEQRPYLAKSEEQTTKPAQAGGKSGQGDPQTKVSTAAEIIGSARRAAMKAARGE